MPPVFGDLRSLDSGIYHQVMDSLAGGTFNLGANLVLDRPVFSLTPRFSAVERDLQPTQPFQRFFARNPTQPGSR